MWCGTGPVVVFVPGFTGSKEDFLPLLPRVAARGLRAVAYDQRGQFESPHTTAPYDLRLFADDLRAVVRSQADSAGAVHLVGHSFGGLVCSEVALDAAGDVASLTLMSTGPGALPPERHAMLEALISIVPHATPEQIWAAKLEFDRQAGAPPLPADVAEFLERRWVASDPRSMAAIASILLTAADPTDRLRRVIGPDLPAQVMYGTSDTTAWRIPDIADMATRLGVTAVPIDAAHSPAVENPEATADALSRFIGPHDV